MVSGGEVNEGGRRRKLLGKENGMRRGDGRKGGSTWRKKAEKLDFLVQYVC